MKRYPDFLGGEAAAATAETAAFHIIPTPFEKSVSYGKGAAQGPRGILEASIHLETFDGVDVPIEAGIHTQGPVNCRAASATTVLERIASRVADVLAKGKTPVLLGGEHTVTVGAVRAVRALGLPFGVVQFDAHADLREIYQGSPLSHGCVMRRIFDLGIPFFQIGVRSLSKPEDEFRKARQIPHLDAEDLARGGLPTSLLPPDFPRDIYITFDVDALDPGVLPATGTPEPGGLSWYEALQLLEMAIAGRRVLGADVVELAPVPGLQASDFTAAKLTYSIIGLIRRLAARGPVRRPPTVEARSRPGRRIRSRR
jgi:agmatinase